MDAGFSWALKPALAGAAIGLGGFLLFATSSTTSTPTAAGATVQDNAPSKPQATTRPFRNCTEARAAGHAPVYAGDPAYGPWLDGDDDGIGCEPYYRH